MNLVEISTFSLNLVIDRLTKIMIRAVKNWAQFQEIKYLKNKIFNKSWSASQIFIIIFFSKRFNQFLSQKNDFENRNIEVFEKVVHNFGKSYDDMI